MNRVWVTMILVLLLLTGLRFSLRLWVLRLSIILRVARLLMSLIVVVIMIIRRVLRLVGLLSLMMSGLR